MIRTRLRRANESSANRNVGRILLCLWLTAMLFPGALMAMFIVLDEYDIRPRVPGPVFLAVLLASMLSVVATIFLSSQRTILKVVCSIFSVIVMLAIIVLMTIIDLEMHGFHPDVFD